MPPTPAFGAFGGEAWSSLLLLLLLLLLGAAVAFGWSFLNRRINALEWFFNTRIGALIRQEVNRLAPPRNGKNGSNGTNGINGTNGTNGTNGINGVAPNFYEAYNLITILGGALTVNPGGAIQYPIDGSISSPVTSRSIRRDTGGPSSTDTFVLPAIGTYRIQHDGWYTAGEAINTITALRQFAVVAFNSLINTGPTAVLINGDVAVGPSAGLLTNFPPGIIDGEAYLGNNPTTVGAQSNLLASLFTMSTLPVTGTVTVMDGLKKA